MEELFKTVVPRGLVRCMAWSSTNLVAISVSIRIEGNIAENCGRASKHQILVFDPNRPWEFHFVYEVKSVVVQLEWSVDGNHLLALTENSTIRVLRMKTQCINNWVHAIKKETPEEDQVVHVAWLDYRPMATIHHAKEDWKEVMEFQPFSSQLRMLLGNAFIAITSKGKVTVTSTSLRHTGGAGDRELSAEISLPGVKDVVIAKTFVTISGSILCAVGLKRGQVKVFSLTASLCWSNEFTLSVILATECHQMSSVSLDKITSLLMLPHPDGCTVHVCHNDTNLFQWSVKDMTRSGSYTSRREQIHTFSKSISSMAGSALCLGSHDPSATENKMSELLLDEDIKEGDGKWPVEVVVAVEMDGTVTVLNRDSYNGLLAVKPEPITESMDIGLPAVKRRRVDQSFDEGGKYLVSLSPSACCLAVANGNSISFYQIGKLILGLKDSTTPEVPRCSRLLSLAAVSYLSPWDLVVTCSRLELSLGSGFLKKVLDHFSKDFSDHSSTLKSTVIRQFFTICSLLHNTMEDGLLPALTYRYTARLHATFSLLTLSLPTHSEEDKTLVDLLQEVCSENSSEDNLETLSSNLPTKEYVIPQDVSSHLQGHCHWLVEMAIKVVSAIAKGNTETIPDLPSLEVLRQCLLLIYTWNKSLPRLPAVTDAALSLLFKVLTAHIQSPSTPLSDDLLSEISGNVPEDKHPNLLTLTKAAHLQGFLSGLSTATLPETFQRGMAPRIRPHVQSKYCSLDPYSPLTLVVPDGLSPPWKDCFVEGQKDILHGGTLSKALVQNARLKQCSRCRSWTLASEGLQADQLQLSVGGGHPVQQWRTAWTTNCLCGGPWTLRSSKHT